MLLGLLPVSLHAQGDAVDEVLYGNHQPEAPAQPNEVSQAFVDSNAERLEKLFDALDLDRQGLEDVRQAHAAGNVRGACNALLAYYANIDRHPPVDPLHSPNPDEQQQAVDALRGVFTFQGVTGTQPRLPAGGLDWTARGPRDDKEWAWFLNRMRFLLDMADAWKATGDPRYPPAISSYIVDWVTHNPYPARLTFSAQWRALEVARRVLDTWTAVFYGMNHQLSPEARLLMLCSLVDHADALRYHSSFWGGNHLLTEKTALALIGASWPEFRDSSAWLDYALRKSEHEIMRQTYPDGAFKELTNHYQRVVLENVEALLRVLRYAGREGEALHARAEQMWTYFAEVMRPDGTGPLNNQGDLEYNRGFVFPVWLEYLRADWPYICTLGQSGQRPNDPPTRFYGYAGQAIMRSGWGGEAQWSFLDMGPAGTAHQQNDRLNLTVTLGQQDFLVDAGRYTYVPGKWADYMNGAAAHNVLLLDGKGPAMPPLEAHGPLGSTGPLAVNREVQEAYDFFSATNRFDGDALHGTGSARHTRSVFYRRGAYWIVVDHVQVIGHDTAQFLWHFHPDVDVAPQGAGVEGRGPHGRRLDVLPAGGDVRWQLVRGSKDPVMGWYSPDYNTIEPATAALATVPARKPFTVVWLLWPADNKGPPRYDVQTRDGVTTITLSRSGQVDTLRVDARAGRIIAADLATE